jgi:hypothetical protein
MTEEDIYFTICGDSKGLSGKKFSTYSEAAKCMEEERESCKKRGNESRICIGTQVDHDSHFKKLRELVRSYRRSGREIEDPMVVLFQKTKKYGIVPDAELTPALYGKDPYVTYGSLEQIESMLGHLCLRELLDRSSFKANRYR